jgi:CheY-like chemotaxis protein
MSAGFVMGDQMDTEATGGGSGEARRSGRRSAELGQQVLARRVLVIEDNVDAAEMLSELLRLEGHTVDIAYDGVVGIRMARDLVPDIVLCDLGLPGASGYDVARELRRDDALRATVLVALSGYAAKEDVDRARAAGFDQHLPKPVDLDRLRGVVERAR